PDIVAEIGERQLYMRALSRWDVAAAARSPPLAYRVDDFVRWSFALYDAIEAVRGRARFGAAAVDIIDHFPLPDETAPGC
ncbi:MAG TPA: hypothetical protein VHB97_09880, partial [Polyangia bacterium]|nr:hypothetical protein [Polyangia bacterium]